jgi:hypothetical protein
LRIGNKNGRTDVKKITGVRFLLAISRRRPESGPTSAGHFRALIVSSHAKTNASS